MPQTKKNESNFGPTQKDFSDYVNPAPAIAKTDIIRSNEE